MAKPKLDYEVTIKGEVISAVTQKPMYVHRGKVRLGGRFKMRMYSVGRMVYSIFMKKNLKESDQVVHLDGNANNNNLDNLRVISAQKRGEILTSRRMKK